MQQHRTFRQVLPSSQLRPGKLLKEESRGRLISWGGCDRGPQTWWLKQQKVLLPQFWTAEASISIAASKTTSGRAPSGCSRGAPRFAVPLFWGLLDFLGWWPHHACLQGQRPQFPPTPFARGFLCVSPFPTLSCDGLEGQPGSSAVIRIQNFIRPRRPFSPKLLPLEVIIQSIPGGGGGRGGIG